MKTLKIIDRLYITEEGLKTITWNKWEQPVHLKQGDLDGACAIYAVMMNLLVLGVVNYSDICVNGHSYDKRYSIEKLKRDLLESKGLHREGNDFEDLKNMLNKSYKQHIIVDYYEHEKENEIINIIDDNIQNDIPVVISVVFKGGAHAMLSVGMEYEDEKPSKVLCLDPSSPAPIINYYISIVELDTGGVRYKHKWLNSADSAFINVKLEDMLIIKARK